MEPTEEILTVHLHPKGTSERTVSAINTNATRIKSLNDTSSPRSPTVSMKGTPSTRIAKEVMRENQILRQKLASTTKKLDEALLTQISGPYDLIQELKRSKERIKYLEIKVKKETERK